MSAEPHRADAGLIGLLDDALLEVREDRIVIGVIEHPQQLLFRESVAGAAISSDAATEDAGAAALPLCLEDAVEDRVLDAFEIASAEPRIGEAVLRVHVLAAAAL